MIEIDENAAGQRIDNFFLRVCKGVPKSHIYRILRSGEVRVNKGRIDAAYRLEMGDLVRVPPIRIAQLDETPVSSNAPAAEFPILFEDDHMIVIDKPAGVAVHGGSRRGVRRDRADCAMRARRRNSSNWCIGWIARRPAC